MKAAATPFRSVFSFKGPVILELSAKDLADGNLPGGSPDWLTASASGIELAGADSLQWEVFVANLSDRIAVSTRLDEVATWVAGRHAAEPSSAGVSHVLGSGFVPLPYTAYENVYRIGAGDRALATTRNGRIELSFSHDYPFLHHKSRQDQQPSTDRFLELLMASLERKLAASDQEGVLLMSSGKNSVSIAVALAEMGLRIPAITYRAWPGNVDPEFAASFCAKLGLPHRTIEMPSNPGLIRRHLTEHFERAVVPSADHAIIPAIVSVAESGVGTGAVVDGGGNDSYMGYVPSQRSRTILRYRIRGRLPATLAARAVRIDSKVNYLTRSLAAATLPGRNLRNHEIRQLYPQAVDVDAHWRQLSRSLRGMDVHDLVAASLIRQTEGARTNDKVRLVASARGMTAVLPFLDEELAEYCFNLPINRRFDAKTGINKVLLCELLDQRLGYDEAEVGKGYFAFDGPAFLRRNAAFVRDEISSCHLWAPEATTVVDGWLQDIETRPFVWHALLSLFMVSGWYNHNPIVSRGA